MHLDFFPFLLSVLPFVVMLFPTSGAASPLPSSSLLGVVLVCLVVVASVLDWPCFWPHLGGDFAPACKKQRSQALIIVREVRRWETKVGLPEQWGKGRKK